MVFSTKGIILHRFKYSDSRIIAKIYTEEFGLQPYLIYASDTKKGLITKSLLQPFFIVDLQVYHNENRELQKIKEISNHFPFTSIPFNIQKNTVCLFLSEFLLKVLKENEQDKDLFNFLLKSIKAFDSIKENFQNFHYILLFKMCKFMGIVPENNFSASKSIFDLEAGRFITGIPEHKNYTDISVSLIFAKTFDTQLDNMQALKISNAERKKLLDSIINYYTIHLGKPGEMKTLEVFRQIF